MLGVPTPDEIAQLKRVIYFLDFENKKDIRVCSSYCPQLDEIMYLWVQDQEVENGYQKPQQHNHVMGHQVDQQKNEILEVKWQFHRGKLAIFHIQ